MKTLRRRTPLDEAPIFANISAEHKREIELAGTRRLIARGKFLFREGDRAQGVHVLLSGRLKSSRFLPGGHEIVMHFINAGDVFGEVPAFLDLPYPACGQAVVESEVFTLPRHMLERVVGRQPEVAIRIFQGMSRKLLVMLDRLEAQTGLRAEQRIARYLVNRIPPGDLAAGCVFRLPVTKKVWATELGMQPESLSRSLALLTRAGAIRVAGKDIEVVDAARLAHYAVPGHHTESIRNGNT